MIEIKIEENCWMILEMKKTDEKLMGLNIMQVEKVDDRRKYDSPPRRSRSHSRERRSKKGRSPRRRRYSRSHSRSRSRTSSRDRYRHRRHRSDRSDSRDRRRRRRDSRSRSRRRYEERRRRRSRSRSRSRSLSEDRDKARNKAKRDKENRQKERDRRAFEDEMARLDRTLRTVQVYNLNLRAEERELFQFFSQAGPLVDIKIIRDKISGRSKGFAYVEFKEKSSVMAALALTGQPLLGQPVMVKMSEAEKNVAWEAAQLAKKYGLPEGMLASGAQNVSALPGSAPGLENPDEGGSKLLVSNLHKSITESDIKPIFEPFGSIDFVTIQRDPMGNSLGQGVVQFKVHSEAERAAEKLADTIDIGGMTMKVQLAPKDMAHLPNAAMAAGLALAGMVPSNGVMSTMGQDTINQNTEANTGAAGPDERIDLDANDGGGLRLTAQSRAALMSRLAANAGMEVPKMPENLLGATNGASGGTIGVQEDLALEQGVLGPSSPKPTECLLLKNMFDPAEETEPGWNREIEDDVKEECSKFGEVHFVHVDSASKGFVYLKFNSVAAATAAQQDLHGRWFNKRQLHAEFQFTPLFNSYFKL